MCSCAPSLSRGGLAIEKSRRSPLSSRRLRCCPALNLTRMPAGKRRCTSITSSARRCRRNTRASVVLRANGSALPIERGAMTRSERGRVLQNSAWPSARSAGLSASPAKARVSPETTRPLQVPHTPFLQEKGISRPARCAASSNDSFGSQGNRYSEFSTVTLKAIVLQRQCQQRVDPRGVAHDEALLEFQVIARGADHVEIDTGRKHACLAVVHDARHHERRLGFRLVAAVLGHIGQTDDVPVAL